MSLLYQFNNIRASVYDEEQDLLIAWHGGHGIHAYTALGEEVCFWNLEGFSKDPTYEEVQSNILEHIKKQDYLDYY